MKYAKFISETEIEFPPLNKGNILNYNRCESELIKDGYKIFNEAVKPQNTDYTIKYKDNGFGISEIIVLPTEEELAERERQRIQGLKCTKRVFVLILQQLGISYSLLKEKIAENEQAQIEWDLCVELERSNPFINIIAEQMGFNSEKVDEIFKIANGETVETEEETPTPTEQEEEQTGQAEEEIQPEEENTENEAETVIDKGEIFDEYFGDDSEEDNINENSTEEI